MKKILLILALVYSFAASAQLDTTKQIQTISAHGYAYKHLQAIYAMLFPTDTLHLKYDWRGIAFKGTSPYFWNGSFWSAFGTGSGSADSTVFATLYRLDTAKANLRASIAAKLSISDTSSMLANLWTQIRKKVDTTNVVPIDTTIRHNNDIVYWDSAARKYKHKTDSVGSGGSGAFSVLKWRTGDENAPAAGDTLIINSAFSGMYGEMYRGSNYGYFLESVVNDTGFTRVNDTTFKVKPAFAANEWYYIRLTDSTALTQVTLQAPSAPPPLLLDTYGTSAGAYSLRLLRTAYTGHAVKVRRSSDNTTQDIDYLPSGYLDTASMKTFVSTGTGYVDTWYDQSGNSYDLTQATTGSQPVIIESGGTVYRQNGKVSIKFTAASSQWMSNGSLAASSAADAYLVQVFKSNAANVGYAPVAMASNALTYQHGSTANKMNAYAGNIYAEAADASTVNHITELVYDGGGATNADKLKYYTNGSAASISSYSGTVPTTISGTGLAIGRFYAVAAGYLDGSISELIVWMNDKSASRSSIESNVNTFYSIH